MFKPGDKFKMIDTYTLTGEVLDDNGETSKEYPYRVMFYNVPILNEPCLVSKDTIKNMRHLNLFKRIIYVDFSNLWFNLFWSFRTLDFKNKKR